MDGPSLARAYYRTIDAGAYDELRDILAAGFVHDRPDRRIEGRETFVRFVREERPETDTEHVVDHLYAGEGRVAVEGRLLRADGDVWFGFVDVFAVADGTIRDLTTYTN